MGGRVMIYTQGLPSGGAVKPDRQPEDSLDAKLKAMAIDRGRSLEQSLLPDLDSLPRSGRPNGRDDYSNIGLPIGQTRCASQPMTVPGQQL